MPDEDVLDILEVALIHRLVSMGVYSDTAEAYVKPVIADFRESYGGTRWMIKRGHRGRYSPTQIKEIKKKYNGNNGEKLQKEYGISRATLYRYLAK